MTAAANKARSPAAVGPSWTAIGPAPATGGQIASGGNVSGRVYSVVSDPGDTTGNTIYVATALGGVWKTINKGQSWSPLTDSLGSLGTTAIVLDPTNTQHVLVATGDLTQSNGSYGSPSFFGAGILYSVDGGKNWTTIGNDPTHFQGQAIFDLAVSPDGLTLYVAALNGFWIGTFTAGSWTFPATARGTGTWTSVRWNPGNPAGGQPPVVDVGAYGILAEYTPSTGTFIASVLPADLSGNVGRTTVAVDPTVPSRVYASLQCLTSCPTITVGTQQVAVTWWGVLSSDDYGATYTHLFLPSAVPGATPFEFSQTIYDLTLAVDPLDRTVVYVGLVNMWLFKTTTSTITNISSPGVAMPSCSQWGTQRFTLAVGIHCDQHGIAFDQAGTLYDTNDGGVFDSPPSSHGGQWLDLNANLNATQFFPGISYNTNNPNRLLGGTQDNGTVTFDGTTWQVSAAGDGGFSAIDSLDPVNTWYSTYVYLVVSKTMNGSMPWSATGGPTWNQATTGFIADPSGTRVNGALFIAPLTMDPANHLAVLAGADRPYLTTDGAGATGWKDIGGTVVFPLTGFNPMTGAGEAISATTICPDLSGGGIFYLGTNLGRAFTTRNGYGAAPTWTEVSAGLPGQWVTRVVCGPAGTAYLTVGGSQTAQGTHVFQKAAGATSWTSIQGNLPNTSVTSIVVDSHTSPATLYVSTDLGVYQSINGGTNWAPYGTGMPNAPVVDLVFDPGRSVMYAATHGRGIWQVSAGFNITVVATPSTIPADGLSSSTVTATVTYGGAPVSGDSVNFSLSGSPPPACGTLNFTIGTTNGSGQVIDTYRASLTVGFCTLTVTEANGGIRASVTIIQVQAASNTWVAGVAGADNALWVLRSGSANFMPEGGLIASAPAIVAVPQTTGPALPLYIATASDHNLYVRNDTNGWQALTTSRVSCLDNPGAVIIAITLYVACQGSDNTLWHAETSVPTGTSLPTISASAWHPLGGVLTFGPAVSAVGGVPTYFVVGTDRHIWMRGLGTGWVATSWLCSGHPAAATFGSATYFACDGVDNALWYSTNTGSGWSPAQPLGGVLVDGVGIAATSSGPIFYGEGADGALWHRTLTIGWKVDGGVLQHGAAATAL